MEIAVVSCFHELGRGADQWTTARSEGRIMINLAYGLAQMGHNVDLYGTTFEHKDHVWPNLNLRRTNEALWKTYDFLFAFDPEVGKCNGIIYKKLLLTCYLNRTLPVDWVVKDLTNHWVNLTAACTPIVMWKHRVLPDRKELPVELLPPLFPIPCYEKLTKQDFQDCTFDPSKKDIKLLAVLTTWNCAPESLAIERMERVLDVLRDKMGYNIALSVIVNDSNQMHNHPPIIPITKKFNPRVIVNNSVDYHGMLDEIYNSDICMTSGDPIYGAKRSQDMVSLGKPLIYVIDTTKEFNDVNKCVTVNDLMEYAPDKCIYVEDDEEVIKEKLANMMANPKEHCEAMKDARIEQTYPVWSKLVQALLDKYA